MYSNDVPRPKLVLWTNMLSWDCIAAWIASQKWLCHRFNATNAKIVTLYKTHINRTYLQLLYHVLNILDVIQMVQQNNKQLFSFFGCSSTIQMTFVDPNYPLTHKYIFISLKSPHPPRRSLVKTPSSRQSQWWEQPSPDSPMWWYTTWGLRCVGTNTFLWTWKFPLVKCSTLDIRFGGRERKEKIQLKLILHYTKTLSTSICLIASTAMNLFTGLFPQTYLLALSKTPFNFNARIDIQNFNYIKKYTSTFGDHVQVHLRTATPHFKHLKKLWVNLNQVDFKSSHSKGYLPKTVECKLNQQRACFKHLIFPCSKL